MEHFDPLIDRIRDRLVLLGEASHGTADDYIWEHPTRRLIEERGFSFVAVEGDCFFDDSSALKPLSVKPTMEGEIPATFPWRCELNHRYGSDAWLDDSVVPVVAAVHRRPTAGRRVPKEQECLIRGVQICPCLRHRPLRSRCGIHLYGE